MRALAGATFAAAVCLLSPLHSLPASAADLPGIKSNQTNAVPACATPGRLMAFLESRNGKLPDRYDGIATEYMRHGEDLGVRWDYAFFQMMLETGNLTYTGDVKPEQNNFAGLGATGRGARGEKFADVSTGVRAHLQHVLMYGGEKIENPVAERTRNIQEWGVLDDWQKTIKTPITYSHLAKKWAPTSRNYVRDISDIANDFYDGPCTGTDPHPEMVAQARKGRDGVAVAKVQKTDTIAKADAAPAGKGAEIAKKAIAEARASGDIPTRTGLGAGELAKVVAVTAPAAPAGKRYGQGRNSLVRRAGGGRQRWKIQTRGQALGLPRLDRELRWRQGHHHQGIGRRGYQLHRAGCQRGFGKARSGRLYQRLCQGR